MRIVAFVNNRVGLEVLRQLRRDKYSRLVGLIVHPRHRSLLRSQIVKASGLSGSRVREASTLNSLQGRRFLRQCRPDIGVSAYFGYILKPKTIKLFPRGIVNVHPAYLPYNRGAYPNVWSLIEGTPAGVSLHWMDSGIDTGALIARRKIPTDRMDTGKTLYEKLEEAAVRLFKTQWPRIRSGLYDSARRRRRLTGGSVHRRSDVDRIDRIVWNRRYRAGDLINLMRARTFPPHKGAYFVHNGQKIYVRLELRRDERV